MGCQPTLPTIDRKIRQIWTILPIISSHRVCMRCCESTYARQSLTLPSMLCGSWKLKCMKAFGLTMRHVGPMQTIRVWVLIKRNAYFISTFARLTGFVFDGWQDQARRTLAGAPCYSPPTFSFQWIKFASALLLTIKNSEHLVHFRSVFCNWVTWRGVAVLRFTHCCSGLPQQVASPHLLVSFH